MKAKLLNNDLRSTVANMVWRVFSGPITLLLIPIYLPVLDQGYWYLFSSLALLSVFADLGFSNIILQFTAHEFANLSFDDKGALVGNELHIKKIASLLRFSLRWVGYISLFVFPIIYIIGVFFLEKDAAFIKYFFPWTLFLIGSLLNFVGYVVLSFLEGMDQISKIQNIKLQVAIINTLVIATLLLNDSRIYALSISSFVTGLYIFLRINSRFKPLLIQLMKVTREAEYPWRKEIMPLFNRYALSFSSGYFIFSMYIPVMHYFYGPVVSGKAGMTLTLVTTVFSFSNIWIYTITPMMNILVSKSDFYNLNKLFNKRLFYSVITYCFIILFAVILYLLLSESWIFPKVISRLLPVSSILILLVCYLFQLVINSWATYLRAYKKEPYMTPSLLVALWVILTSLIAGKFLSSSYFFVGFLTSYVWWLPVAFLIYKRCQKVGYEKS